MQYHIAAQRITVVLLSQLGALVRNMAEEDDRVAGQRVEVSVRLFFTPLVEWIIRIVSAEMANLLRQGIVAEVIDKGQPPRLGRVVGKIKGGIDA